MMVSFLLLKLSYCLKSAFYYYSVTVMSILLCPFSASGLGGDATFGCSQLLLLFTTNFGFCAALRLFNPLLPRLILADELVRCCCCLLLWRLCIFCRYRLPECAFVFKCEIPRSPVPPDVLLLALVSAAAADAYSYLFYFHAYTDWNEGYAFIISLLVEAAPNLLLLALCAGDVKIRVLRLCCRF